MKKKIYRLKFAAWVCLALFMNTACSDWLDVKPKTEEEADRLFSNEEGFKSALAGAYIALCQPELYGKELTYGMVGILGQEWSKGGSLDISSSAYANLQRYKYGEVSTKPIVEKVWLSMYKTIANVNTLIEYTEKKQEVFHGDNYEMIRGEAIALRAFIHFDLLRLYADYNFGDSVKSIPYVKTSKPAITGQSTANEVVKLALEDINSALKLLEKDPIFTGKDVAGADNGYLANRNFHLNYYAVQGLKARICLYAGDLEGAKTAAQIVIDAQNNAGVFPWVNKNDITNSNSALRDRTFSTEQLFAFNMPKLNEYIKGYFKETQLPLSSRIAPKGNSGDFLYAASDYRGVFFETDNGLADVYSKFWQMDNQTIGGSVVRPKRNRMPSIRISEMYYIAAECNKTANPALALEDLNKVRKMRGLTEKLTNTDPIEIQKEILKEYQREFLGEGQLFFYHKRMETKKIATANAVYKLPMPDAEIDLGERD
ncbi:MAG: RagB/SusD family nutrient uptake outer membrane protein [Odoribacter sp.]